MSSLPSDVSLDNPTDATDALRDWLHPSTTVVDYDGSDLSVAELLESPRTALRIATHENDAMWNTHARIAFTSATEATVIVSMKGMGGTDRLRFSLTQPVAQQS